MYKLYQVPCDTQQVVSLSDKNALGQISYNVRKDLLIYICKHDELNVDNVVM